MLSRRNQEPAALDAMQRSISELLTIFALAGYALLGEAIRVRQTQELDTAGTDGRHVWYNPAFWMWLPATERVFVLLHEFLHVFYGHFARRGGRDPKVWGKAIDVVTNVECSIILHAPIPDHGVHPPSWYIHGRMTAEEVYDRLIQDMTNLPQAPNPAPFGDSEFSNSTDLLPPPPGESEEEKKDWIERLRKDIAQARLVNETAGHSDKIPEGMLSRLEKILKGTVPWSRLFRGSVQNMLGYDVATFAKPNKKTYPRIPLPTYLAIKERVLLIAIDVSASVVQERLNVFASNIQNAAQRATKTIIVTFDKEVRERYETDRPKEILKNIKLLMGHHSHTDARGVFEVADEVKPTVIACLTDGYIVLPDKPYRNTVWVRPVEPEGRALPWGREFIMEELF